MKRRSIGAAGRSRRRVRLLVGVEQASFFEELSHPALESAVLAADLLSGALLPDRNPTENHGVERNDDRDERGLPRRDLCFADPDHGGGTGISFTSRSKMRAARLAVDAAFGPESGLHRMPRSGSDWSSNANQIGTGMMAPIGNPSAEQSQ